MQVFKTTLRIVFRSPLYLLLYIVFFGILGAVIAASSAESLGAADTQSGTLVDAKPTTAVIDRDHSDVSRAIADYLRERSTPVAVEDTSKALQDATALNEASYIVIIPEGYGEEFVNAVQADAGLGSDAGAEPGAGLETDAGHAPGTDNQAGAGLPQLRTVVNYAESEAIYMDLVINEYLSALRVSALASPDAPVATILANATEAAGLQAHIDTVTVTEDVAPGALAVFSFQWMAYPLTTGLIALTATIFSVFNKGELRRRNLCSPVSSTRMNTQVALGSLSMVLMSWAFLVLLAMLPASGGAELVSTDPGAFALLALAALVYAFVPFAIGFLLSQVGVKDLVINGIANIVSLSLCFISGIFMPSASFLGEGVQAIARFTPTYWYSQAVHSMDQGMAAGPAELTTFYGYLGIVALFALAIFSVALLIGHSRTQSADMGGNPAADALL